MLFIAVEVFARGTDTLVTVAEMLTVRTYGVGTGAEVFWTTPMVILSVTEMLVAGAETLTTRVETLATGTTIG